MKDLSGQREAGWAEKLAGQVDLFIRCNRKSWAGHQTALMTRVRVLQGPEKLLDYLARVRT